MGRPQPAYGTLLFFATLDLRKRWLTAAAGALWLTLHGIVHIYEVSSGICGPRVFWADEPGVLGPSLLVFVAIAILLTREHTIRTERR
jgi:hypothetical protein